MQKDFIKITEEDNPSMLTHFCHNQLHLPDIYNKHYYYLCKQVVQPSLDEGICK